MIACIDRTINRDLIAIVGLAKEPMGGNDIVVRVVQSFNLHVDKLLAWVEASKREWRQSGRLFHSGEHTAVRPRVWAARDRVGRGGNEVEMRARR